jgi:hypothetical protein
MAHIMHEPARRAQGHRTNATLEPEPGRRGSAIGDRFVLDLAER